MQFSDATLNPRLLINLHKHGFTNATAAQAQGLPVTIAGKDLMLSADTGSGKTLAFLVPCVHRLLNEDKASPSTRCLILAPTRELAHQILTLTHRLLKGTRLQVALILGGEDYAYQTALLRKNPEIIIATPGRFMEHQRKNHTDTVALEILVVDEADRMLELGFVEDVMAIASAANSQRQTLFYSATLQNTKVRALASELLIDPVEVTLNDATQVQANIQQQAILCDDIAHKQRVLVWLLANHKANKRLIFVNSRQLSVDLADFLHHHGHPALALHGELPQDKRNAITSQFRKHSNNLLVATEVAARGLDITQIDQVINFDLARNLDDYLHRVGRTGRAGKAGQAIALVNLSERNLLLNLEKAQGKPIERIKIKGLAAKSHRDKEESRSFNNTCSLTNKKTKTSVKNSTKKTPQSMPKNCPENNNKLSKKHVKKAHSAETQARAKVLWEDGNLPLKRKPNQEN